jgi:ElaB/YqjD/DUF883 family membrane-anchored ribosome-binding protein
MRNGTAHAIPSKDLVKEINALKSQLKRVSDAMASDASDALEAVESKGRETLDETIAAAQTFIDGYTDAAKDAADRLTRKSAAMRDDATDSLVATVQARPLGTLAAVVGIGFLAGFLLRRR